MNATFANNLINSSIYYLLNFEKFSNFPQAARQAAINNNYQIVLFSDDFNTLFSVETRHNKTIEQAVLSSFNQNLDREAKGARVDVDGLTTYWGPVNIAGRKYYLMLVDNENSFNREDIVKLAEIIELAMGMWNYVPTRDPSGEFLRALRRGNRELAHTLCDELQLAEKDIAAIYLIQGVKKKSAQQVLAQFQANHKFSVISNADHDEICGLILRGPETVPYTVEDWEDLSQQMYECGAHKTFHVRGLNGIDDTCNGFRLIGETEAFVQLVFPYRNSFSKYEMAFASACVNLCINGGALKRNLLELVSPLLGARDAKTCQLKYTLETYILDANLSTAKTAELMDIHANTVQYRIKNIKEMLGVDITSNTVVPGLMMALGVTRIEKEAGSF